MVEVELPRQIRDMLDIHIIRNKYAPYTTNGVRHGVSCQKCSEVFELNDARCQWRFSTASLYTTWSWVCYDCLKSTFKEVAESLAIINKKINEGQDLRGYKIE